jgi:hypothetical protein
VHRCRVEEEEGSKHRDLSPPVEPCPVERWRSKSKQTTTRTETNSTHRAEKESPQNIHLITIPPVWRVASSGESVGTMGRV